MNIVKTKIFLLLFASALLFQGCKKKEPTLATITLGAITEITDATAKVEFNVTSDGYSTILEKGVRVSDRGCPSCELGSIKFVATGTIGQSSILLTGLKKATQYTVAAYVTNEIGTTFSNSSTFNTSAKVPTVSPDNSTIVGIKASTAIFTNYRITDDGGTTAFYSGVCWSTNSNPTINDAIKKDTIINKIYASWNVDILNLKPNTKYYVRPFAINSVGVGYGKELSFTTDPNNSCQPNVIEPENTINQIIPIPGDKFMILGSFQKINGINHSFSAVFNNDGAFDNNYKAATANDHIAFFNNINTSSILTNGKFLIPSRNTATGKNTVIRLNGDGSIDQSFKIPTGTSSFVVKTFALADGKIIIVGRFTDFNGVPANRVVKLNADGSIDGTFALSSTFNFGSVLNAVQLSNGSIVIQSAATNSYQNYVIKADGSFDTGSKLHNSMTHFINSVLKNGQFLCTDAVTSAIRRMNADGTIDNSFNAIKIAPTQTATSSYFVNELSDNKYLIAISSSFNSQSVSTLYRLNNNGTPDVSFGGNGSGGLEFRNGTIFTTAIAGDGKILVGGSFSLFMDRVARNFIKLNADGSFCK